MKVKEVIEELKTKNPESEVYILLHRSFTSGLYKKIEFPVFENEETGEEDTKFTMITIDTDETKQVSPKETEIQTSETQS